MLVVDKVLNAEVEHTSTLLNLPHAGRLVARARHKEAPVPAKVERVDLLHVTLEKVSDALLLNVPDLALVMAAT